MTGPTVRPKCPPRPEAKLKSDGVNDVWCVDVVFDTTQHGTMVKFLTLLDKYGHYSLAIVASRRMGSREAVAALKAAIDLHGPPAICRCEKMFSCSIARHPNDATLAHGASVRVVLLTLGVIIHSLHE